MATEAKTQLIDHSLMSPKAKLKPEKKPGHGPRSHGDGGVQKEKVIPGIVDFEMIRDALKSPKAQTPGTYRFGRLSHHSFFSRHHPHPQRMTHIQDLTGKQVCCVKDEFSLIPWSRSALLSSYLMGMPTVPGSIGDPQSNRNPRLSTETWKRELKELASRVTLFTKETEQKNKEVGQQEPPLREHGAKYSAETGRLIPASTRTLQRRSFRQGQRSHLLNNDGHPASVLHDQELLILELLCQILQTDSLSAIQFWLLYAPSKEKDVALGLLQTAVAQLLPQPLMSIPEEKLLNQLQEVQEPQENLQASYSLSQKKAKIPPTLKSENPEYIGKAQVLKIHNEDTEARAAKPKAQKSKEA
ncbi:protein TBATA [Perognathus longimembris pacificus]|uniref:protein TBATA n=1 Tax=Perognathus longimembris pacificus TaxID=214514 RepID=UPI002019F29F|nr:protein TBATA [Perognathus longimembris pacificus]